MRVLLDTHTFLWWASGGSELSDRARELIADDRNDVVFSVVVAWEIVIKATLGRLSIPEPPDMYIPTRLRSFGFSVLPVHLRHVLGLSGLPDLHRDPFDRLLVAQARSEEIPIVTRDERVRAYPVEVLWD